MSMKKYDVDSPIIDKAIQKCTGIYKVKQIIYKGEKTHYLIDTCGFVYSVQPNGKLKKIKPKYIKRYLGASLSIDGKFNKPLIHRLVMNAFCPNPDPSIYTEVNHIDGDPENNWIENLEWVTHSQNIQHAYDNNLMSDCNGENAPSSKITKKQAIMICELLEENKLDMIEISEKVGVSYGIVAAIRDKIGWRSVSKDYNIDNYNVMAKKRKITKEIVHNICKDIQNTDMTPDELAAKYGIQKYRINCIIRCDTWSSISKDYDFNHRKTKKNKKT